MQRVDQHLSTWWATKKHETTFPTLGGEVHVDVAIIGAGITGVTLAKLLKEAGLRVAVIEATRVGGHTTGSTTAHLSTSPDRDYSVLEQRFGTETIREVAQAMKSGVDYLEAAVKHYGIDCGFERTPAYYYAEDAQDLEYLREEYSASQRAGLSVAWLESIPTPFPTAGGFRIDNQAAFHALDYLHGMVGGITGNGSHVFEHSRVTSIQAGEPCVVETDLGRVFARDVVQATHLPLEINPLQTTNAPYRSYVIEVMLEAAAPQGLFWDTAEPYHYTRHITGMPNTLIIGGADHKTGQTEDEEACFGDLERYARERYKVKEIVRRWSSQYYVPADGLPYIGRSPLSRHVWVATGYSGVGTTFGTVAALALSDELLGRINPHDAIFSPRRIGSLASKEFFKENLNVAAQLVKDRLPGMAENDLTSLSQGEGRLLDLDGERLAVYRDDLGKVHLLSPACTHMGCHVNWNSSEKTWDCPCHGGRYRATGEVLLGPPMQGLARKRL